MTEKCTNLTSKFMGLIEMWEDIIFLSWLSLISLKKFSVNILKIKSWKIKTD